MEKTISNNRWNKVYWFSRMLINNDKYAAIGKNEKLLREIISHLEIALSENVAENDPNVIKKLVFQLIKDTFFNRTSYSNRILNLINDLEIEIETIADAYIFLFTCQYIMRPLNDAIKHIPSDDKVFSYSYAKAHLEENGIKGLAKVIGLWDDLGIRGCLDRERDEIVRTFSTLRIFIEKGKSHSDEDSDVVLTALVQEFERRAAQKRKARAGGSLEDVTQFILDFYKIKNADAPEHFQTDIEVDNWVKTKDGWLIGISCKRTLRERWKQVSSADRSALSRHKIKKIFHVVTFDEDLSDEKLALLGSNDHVFYVPDNSRRLQEASGHVALKTYIKPISSFVDDLKHEISTR